MVTSDDLRDAPEAVLNRVRDALIDRGAVGIRRRFKTEWMRYFAPAPDRFRRFGGKRTQHAA